MNKKKIFLVAGGSGGHLFPAIALSKSNKYFDYHFVIDFRTESLALKNNLKYNRLVSSNLNLNFKLPISILKIIFACVQSIIILIMYKPKLVIGFGGYTTVPTILMARIFNIRIILHEQNAIMGKANRFLSRFAKSVALTFKNTKFKTSNGVYTGIPVRKKRIRKIKRKFKTIFIVGGSQGAKVFSTVIPKIIKSLDPKLKKNLHVVQQVKKNEKKIIENIYKEMKIKFEIKYFFDDIYDIYEKSDIIISRCGSSTLAEIEIFRKFSILFPLPSAMDNHQYFNALEFKKNNECIIVDEKNLDIMNISRELEKHISDTKKSSNKIKKKYDLSLSDLIKNSLNND